MTLWRLKMLYHASKIAGLTELKPYVSTHGKGYVYAIRNGVTALYGLTDAELAQDERFIKYHNALLEK